MTPLPFENLGDAIVFWAAYALWIVPEFVRGFTHRSGSGSTHDDRGSYAALVASIYVAMALAFTLAFSAPAAAFTSHRQVWFVLGILLIVAGVFFRAYVIRILGRSFTFDVATRADQQVCESGPYRFIRHPSYTGTLVTIAGIGLALGNWASLLAALAVAAAAHAYRVGVEERVLSRDLGEPYTAYMRRTHRFIPFIF